MKYQLIIMRHAKSDWTTDAPTDHARPLNRRGRRDAPAVGMRLRELGWIPDLVLSSDAQRTRETLECMRESLDDPPAIFLEELYHAGLGALSAALAEVSPTTDRVLVLGHNPGWQDCVHQLTGVGCTMTTANAALMEIEATDWQHAVGQHGQWEWIELIQPKQL